jgi:histidine triad (HIT) family protein
MDEMGRRAERILHGTGEDEQMNPDDPCVFCEIVAGRAPATVVRDWPDALAIVPLNPVTDGHTLVMPKIHSTDFTTSSEALLWAMMCAAALGREMGGPMNLITSKGTEATQSVFHLHLHLVPRAKDDGLALPWYSGKGNHR